MSRWRRAFSPELELRVLNEDGTHEVIDRPGDFHEACLEADIMHELAPQTVVLVWHTKTKRALYDSRLIAAKRHHQRHADDLPKRHDLPEVLPTVGRSPEPGRSGLRVRRARAADRSPT